MSDTFVAPATDPFAAPVDVPPTVQTPAAVDPAPAAPASTPKEANARYGRATTALRKAHEAEFLTLLAAEYEKDGAVYKPRLTADEKAAQAKAAKRTKLEAEAAKVAAELAALS